MLFLGDGSHLVEGIGPRPARETLVGSAVIPLSTHL